MTNELNLSIHDLSRGGAGVGRDAQGRIVFVPFTTPGDQVRARITSSEKNYAQGELLEILTPSPQRIQPLCSYFQNCGGCQWQHLPYSLQWTTKAEGAKHALRRTLPSVAEALPWDLLPAEQIWNYRNRIQLRGEGEKIGFFQSGSRSLVPITQCAIARPELNAIIEETRIEGSKLPQEYKVEIEILPDGSVRKSWNAKHAAQGFRQVHDLQNEKLKHWVQQHITPHSSTSHRVLDLFGGAGNLSLGLAATQTEIHCVDVSSPRSRIPGQPQNFTFHPAPVARWLHSFIKKDQAPQPTSAILDPPREGLGSDFVEIESALRKVGTHEVLLVGCDADSWARDVSRFSKKGWSLCRLGVLDLFPQTPHVESLALLRL